MREGDLRGLELWLGGASALTAGGVGRDDNGFLVRSTRLLACGRGQRMCKDSRESTGAAGRGRALHGEPARR